MKYEVVWNPVAERRLTQLWLASRLRHAIRNAADRIDAELKRNPHACGESRDGDRRVMFVWPLGASFTIDEDQHKVQVISVWQI